jgi:hypothetical protein
MEVEFLHRDNLAIASARRSSLDAERGTLVVFPSPKGVGVMAVTTM